MASCPKCNAVFAKRCFHTVHLMVPAVHRKEGVLESICGHVASDFHNYKEEKGTTDVAKVSCMTCLRWKDVSWKVKR